jgi:hypothetical protein
MNCEILKRISQETANKILNKKRVVLKPKELAYNPLNRFMKREGIIEFLLRLTHTEETLTKITNYKYLLESNLKALKFDEDMMLINVMNLFKLNDIPELSDEQLLIKNKILELIEKRQKDYEAKINSTIDL